MMNRSSDIIFMAEYIKNVLYFATIRQGKTLKSTADTHYFSIDNELVYENYYSDFGPLNLGSVYRYCKLLNEKLKFYLNKQTIVHYTSIDPKKKANAAFLMGCYGVLYLSLHPRDALKPLTIHGQSYRPFQDATQGDSTFTITILDCLQGISKARELGFFNFQDFNYEEYERLDKIQGGDLNWIVPGKFLAFIGPVDFSVSLYHPPEMYIDYFLENGVKIVIRLNKKLYDGNVFNAAGIIHYDLYFPDGSCPPRHILMKFLQISEESDSAIAVHCKAGLGRTGSLIGCYLMKHYRMTSHEAISWMRICRPGSVIGHQQGWLEQLEAWLIKQGNLYRKRMYNDIDRLPYHNFGVYSISERTSIQRPMTFHKSPSPTPTAAHRPEYTVISPVKPQASKIYSTDKSNDDEEEVFLTSCDLTIQPSIPMTQMKGCIIKNNTISEEYDEATGSNLRNPDAPLWKKILCCKWSLKDQLWRLSVRCAKVAPDACKSNVICGFADMVTFNKNEKEQFDRRVKSAKMSSQKFNQSKGKDPTESNTSVSRRGIGSGEPRAPRSQTRAAASRPNPPRNATKFNESNVRNLNTLQQPTVTTFRTTNGPTIKSVSDARNFLLRSSKYNEERDRHLQSTMIVTPKAFPTHPSQMVENPNYYNPNHKMNLPQLIPSTYSAASKSSSQPQRRRLGRSPSPQQSRVSGTEQTRITNTDLTNKNKCQDKYCVKDISNTGLKEALSRLKLKTARASSIGAASLEARRDAPAAPRAPSVRSDERPHATQGDLLNSIKFQKRLRDTLLSDKLQDKLGCLNCPDKGTLKKINPRLTSGGRLCFNPSVILPKDNTSTTSRNFRSSPPRPMSPKPRRSPNLPLNF